MDRHHSPLGRSDLLRYVLAARPTGIAGLDKKCTRWVALALVTAVAGADMSAGQVAAPPANTAQVNNTAQSNNAAQVQAAQLNNAAQVQAGDQAKAADQASAVPPALRVVKLLWKTQPTSAATALEKSIDQALVRRQVDLLRPHLPPLAERLRECLSSPSDPRWVAATAALALAGDPSGIGSLRAAVDNSGSRDAVPTPAELSLEKREFLLRAWLEAEPEKAVAYLRALLERDGADAKDVAWLEIAALRSLQADRAATTAQLIRRWNGLPKNLQVAAIEPLTQQADSMRQLVEAISQGKISKDLVNTNQLLKWSAGNDQQLSAAIERVWGQLRASEDADRKAVVTRITKLLRSGKVGRPEAGEQVFKRVCSQCHRLHGQGIEVGPDITSNGRGSFEQLVSNVMDPSLVIGTAFLAKTILTTDGQVLAGLVAAEDPQRITLKIQGGKLVELDREEDIEQVKASSKSLMPDGLEQQMNEQELVDLFAYLSLVRPLSAPENETIAGTPPKLVP